MNDLLVTCDRNETHIRAAVWQNGILRDLFVDRIERPDLSGAVVCARIVRLSQRCGWADAGLKEKIYFENVKNLSAGSTLLLRLQSTLSGGKGWIGHVEPGPAERNETGLVAAPPAVWEKAISACSETLPVIRFSFREDYETYLKSADKENGRLASYEKEPFHPELDDIIETLLAKRIPLSGGGEIVIEQTEAFVAIDINAGEKGQNLAVNLLATKEIARQIRLRQLAGLILVDALKMKERADNSKVVNALTRACEKDPAGAKVYGMTKLGVLEMTRTRLGPSLNEILRQEV